MSEFTFSKCLGPAGLHSSGFGKHSGPAGPPSSQVRFGPPSPSHPPQQLPPFPHSSLPRSPRGAVSSAHVPNAYQSTENPKMKSEWKHSPLAEKTLVDGAIQTSEFFSKEKSVFTHENTTPSAAKVASNSNGRANTSRDGADFT